MKIYYTHRRTPTCFGHSSGNLQGGALQSAVTSKYYWSIWNNVRV